jgi:hypothetical protein
MEDNNKGENIFLAMNAVMKIKISKGDFFIPQYTGLFWAKNYIG